MATTAAFDASKEDAALNQYWYSPHTIAALVREVEHHATSCAFLSSPSLYFALTKPELKAASKLLEFDRQWSSDPGFVFYDFNRPMEIPIQLMECFDYVVVDPPFITREVWSKYLETVELLLKKGGKVLFTSVLENHAMLEEGVDQGLYVPLFKPSIPHLTYQYHCFTNYIATTLQFDNPEVPPEDPKTRSALRMANDLRESEKEFTAQMRNRDRAGEKLLPAQAAEGAESSSSSRIMKWTHVPEGLTMYANGAEAPPEPEAEIDFGPEFKSCERRRALLDSFKRGVDQSQRFLDTILKNTGKESAASVAAISDAEKERLALLESMIALANELAADESKSAADANLVPIMKQCVEAYRDVKIEKLALQELAADATRKFKSPAFNRQKELLAEMKAIKAAAKDRVNKAASTTTACEE